MTRHDAITEILAIVDAALPPVAAAVGGLPQDSAPSQTGGSPENAAGRRKASVAKPKPAPEPIAKEQDRDALDLKLAREMPMTDLGNAQRFVARNKERFLWASVLGWLYWDGKRWARDGADDRLKMAEHATVRAIADEAAALADSKFDRVVGRERDGAEIWRSDKLYKWATASQAASKLAPVARHAAPYLAVDVGRLDADPFALNVNNGTLVIRKTADADYVTLRAHNPADLITKLAPVHYDPAAACPLFDKFLAEIQRDAETRAFLLRWQGYQLTGDTSEQKLAVYWGKGRNGKSVLVDTCAFIGGDYAETVPIETFLAEGRGRSAGQATPDLAILPGKRSLRTSEPTKGAALDEALIKLATGGEPIQARHLNRDYFKFYPVFKLTISGNYRPKIGGTDEGIWGRVVLVPFTEFIPPDKRDPQLTAKLRGEASGILNRLLDGLRQWLDRGLTAPKEVTEATADYRRDSDQLGRWLESCVERVPRDADGRSQARVQSSAALACFNAWAKAGGGSEWRTRGFSDAMVERGFKKDKSSAMYWLDIKLLKTADDFVDRDGRPLQGGEMERAQGPPGGDEIAF